VQSQKCCAQLAAIPKNPVPDQNPWAMLLLLQKLRTHPHHELFCYMIHCIILLSNSLQVSTRSADLTWWKRWQHWLLCLSSSIPMIAWPKFHCSLKTLDPKNRKRTNINPWNSANAEKLQLWVISFSRLTYKKNILCDYLLRPKKPK
jgi:hypothetical protein